MTKKWMEYLEYAMEKGLSLSAACTFAGVSVETAREYGYKSNRKTIKDLHGEVTTLREKGYTYASIGKKLGYHTLYIANYCRSTNIIKGKPTLEEKLMEGVDYS